MSAVHHLDLSQSTRVTDRQNYDSQDRPRICSRGKKWTWHCTSVMCLAQAQTPPIGFTCGSGVSQPSVNMPFASPPTQTPPLFTIGAGMPIHRTTTRPRRRLTRHYRWNNTHTIPLLLFAHLATTHNASVRAHTPFPPLDNIRVMVIVWRLRGNIIRTALCWIVWHNVHSQQHTYMSSSYRSNRLGLSHWDPYAVRRGGCLELYYCNMVEWLWWDSSLIFDDQLVSFNALTLLVWSSGL